VESGKIHRSPTGKRGGETRPLSQMDRYNLWNILASAYKTLKPYL